MTRAAVPRRQRPRATAARQALTLCEAELLTRPRISAAAARAALRAAGVPPHIAARFRNRLHLIPEPESEQ